MTLATANIKYIFGLKTDIIQNIFYHDERTVVYACGRHCILLHTDNKTQKYITASDKGLNISAMAMSPNHSYLAVALKCERPIINVFDLATLRRRKTLNTNDPTADKIISLSFSSDSRCIAALTGDPGWTIFCWTWEKSKLLVTTKVIHPAPLYSLIFNPTDYAHMCIIGNGILRSFRFVEGALKPFNFPRIETQDFRCFCWVSDEKLLIGTSNGKILYIEGRDLKKELNLDITDQVTAIASFSKGFACACGPGMIHFFDRIFEDRDFYKKNRQALLLGDPNDVSKLQQQIVKGMVVSPSEEYLVVTTDMNQLYWTPISTEFLNRQMNQTSNFNLLAPGSHFAPITGLSVCVWKPLIATSSEDSFIRIWNFEKFTLELAKEFVGAVHSISIHPMGLFLLAGLTDKLYLMYILKDDLKKVKDFPIRECNECSFNRGGQLFAAVRGKVVQIYSSVTFDLIINLKGHNDKVEAVIWNADDSRVLSCGLDGAIYDWDYKTGRRIGQCVLTTCRYTDITTHLGNKYIYAVGSDRTLKEILESDVLRAVPLEEVLLTSIAMSRSCTMLFAGTNTGYLQSFKCPVLDETITYIGHSKEISRMVFTDDDMNLITVSKDASVIVWGVREKDGLGIKREKRVDWSEEILISQSELEEKNKMLSELRNRIEELDTENESMLQVKDMYYQGKMKEMTSKFIQEMEALKTKNLVLQNEKIKEETRHEEKLAEVMERHSRELERTESVSDKKLVIEYNKCKEIKNNMLKMQEDYDKQIMAMEEKAKMDEQKLTEHFQEKLNDLTNKMWDAENENRIQKNEYEEIIRQNEKDFDTEITRMQTRYEQELHKERTINNKMQTEIAILKNRLHSYPKEIKECQEENRKFQSEITRLNSIIMSQEKDIQSLRKQLQREERGLQEEEVEFYKSKIKKLELEKLSRDVEFYKIDELKRLIKDREMESMNMKRQIKAMQRELENYNKQFVDMEQSIENWREKLAATTTELSKERAALKKKSDVLNRFQRDLHHCTSFIQDPKVLKSCIQILHQKYMHGDMDTMDSIDPNVQEEWNRQRAHLENCIDRMRSHLKKMRNLLHVEREKNRALQVIDLSK